MAYLNLSIKHKAPLATVLLACTAMTPATVYAQTPDDEGDVVVVTTQRREQNILDVPYNVTVVQGQDIQDSVTLDNAELLRSIPGASQIDQGPRAFQFNSIRIRGLNVDSSAFGDFLLGSVPTVATYVNQTPVFANLALIDLDRVEVQRGPQATLYGSGAIGGTVQYFTNKPQLGEVEGQIIATGSQARGSDGFGYTTGGILNLPAGDKFAVRANILWQDFPGITDYTNLYVLDDTGVPTQPLGLFASGPNAAEFQSKDDVDDYQSLYARISALWAPTENIEIVGNYFYQDDETGGRRQPSQGNDGLGNPYGEFENGAVIEEPADREFEMFSLEADIDLGFATLTSASSVYENSGTSATDNTGFFANNLAQFYYSTVYTFPRPLYTADRTFSDESFIQEVRLASNSPGRFEYVVGLY
ncbi:MAG: TonB-dependent receptor plug domain-containing protein, partial [Pseudomonadota bacterium]